MRIFVLMLPIPLRDAHHRHAHRDAEGDLRQDHALRRRPRLESISTPRLIGPGCITMASGLASASFRREAVA